MSLFLQIWAGTQSFLLDASVVVRVLPRVAVTNTAHPLPGACGIINYQGQEVPVLDLCHRLLGRPADQRLNTRLVLVSPPQSRDAAPCINPRLIALRAEKVSDVVRLAPHEFLSPGPDAGHSHPGSVAEVRGLLVRKLDLTALLGDLRHPAPVTGAGASA
jgi:chemotaxis-related protein WspB